MIKQTGARVRVSLYGHEAAIHEAVTLVKGSFEKTETALRLLKENGINTTVAVIVMSKNEKYVTRIKAYIESLGHKYSGFDVIRPVPGGNQSEFRISDYELLKERYQTKADFSVDERSF